MNVTIERGGYKLEVVEDTKGLQAYLSDEKGQTLLNSYMGKSASNGKDKLDFYLAGIAVFSNEAIARMLHNRGVVESLVRGG